MGIVRIMRTSEFNNQIREFKILIDETQVGTIENGETKDFHTKAGQHIVVARIDWCGSKEVIIDVKENRVTNLKVGGFKYSKMLIPIGFGLIVLHYILSISVDFEYTIYLVVPLFLTYLYYLTFGRNFYLTLEKINDNEISS